MDAFEEKKKQEEVPMIPKYQAETTFMHLSWANRRMLIALICVCATFIITILVFVHGYTEREKNWLDTIGRLTPEVATNGIQQQPDP